MSKLDSEIEIQKQKVADNNVASGELKTTEIILGVKRSLEGMKELKQDLETKLIESTMKNQELEEGLIEEKEVQLKKLKNEFVKKKLSNNLTSRFKREEKIEKVKDNLDICLDFSNSLKAREIAKKYLLKKEKENSELSKLLEELRGRQISLLKVKGETIREIKSKEIIDVSYDIKKANKEEISPNIILRKQVSNYSNSSTEQTEKYTYKKSKVRT